MKRQVFWYLRKVIIAIILQTLAFPSYSQFDERSSYLSPAPNASALIRSTNTAVNLYSGVASINAELFMLQGRKFSLPVALSYQSSGIKVTDVASDVGLGWSISTNCMITRMVAGRPDEQTNGYFASDMGQKIYGKLDASTLFNIIDNQKDAEPDLFYYNLNGQSGKFVFNNDKKPVMLPDNGVRILNSPFKKELGIDGWILQDLSGNKYFLGTCSNSIENTQTTYHGENQNHVQSFTSSWYLDKIITINNIDTVSFNYQTGNAVKIINYFKKRRYRKKITTTFNRGIYFFGIPIKKAELETDIETVDQKDWDSNTEKVIQNPHYLASITTSNQSVVFQYDNNFTGVNRKDLNNGWILNKAKIYSFKNDLLREYNFHHSYTESVSGVLAGCPDQDKYRLRLDSIREQQVARYRFVYNPGTMPTRYSQNVDHWGYYGLSRGFFQVENLTGYFKETVESHMQIEVLRKIIYETGGYREFVFEANDFYNVKSGTNQQVGGLRIKKVINVGGLNTPPVTTSYTYTDDKGRSTGKRIEQLPTYISYLEHQDSPIIYRTIGVQPFDQQQYNVTTMRGDMVLPIPMKNVFINSLASSLPNLLNIGQTPSNKTYTPFIIQSSVSHNTILDINGSYVGYSEVTIRDGKGGKIVNKFTDIDDYPDYTNQVQVDKNFIAAGRLSPNTSPFTPLTSYAFARGYLKESSVYDDNGVLLNRTTNKYIINSECDSVKGFRCSLGKIKYSNNVYNGYSEEFFNVGSYYYVSKNLLLKETLENTFTPGISGSLSKQVSYEYNSDFPLVIKKQTEINSDGSVISSAFKWVKNKDLVSYSNTSETEAASQLYEDGAFGVPLEQTTYRNGTIISTKKTGYRKWAIGSKQLVLPETIYEGNGRVVKPEITFREYDQYGNAIQKAEFSGAVVSYGRGQNNLYPVYECLNAKPEEIFFEDFEENTHSSVTVGPAHSGRKYFAGDYAVTFNPPPGKDYKISYWYLESSQWLYSGELAYSGPFTIQNGSAIDDVKVIPEDAYLGNYVYSDLGLLISKSDINGLTTFYSYDDLFRLTTKRDYRGNILEHINYNTVSSPVSQVYTNAAVSKNFTTVCSRGVGSVVPYLVPEGKYYSYVSQAEADAKAAQEIQNNGQRNANSKGKCAVYARVELKNKRWVNDGYYYKKVADASICFYWDPAGNTPATTSEEMDVAIKWHYIWTNGLNDSDNYSTNEYYTVPYGTSKFDIGWVELEGYHSYYDIFYETYFEESFSYTYSTILYPGSNYVTAYTY